jgi:hypothetical protein
MLEEATSVPSAGVSHPRGEDLCLRGWVYRLAELHQPLQHEDRE